MSFKEGTIVGAEPDARELHTQIGQHLLTDRGILDQIVGLVPSNADCIEIGPGFGALTEGLLGNNNKVTAYEIDERCQPALDELSRRGDLTVKWQNFLDASLGDTDRDNSRYIVGNIPFHISEPLISRLVGVQFEAAILLVGERLATTLITKDPSSPNWSRVAMVAQGYFDVTQEIDVPRESFLPPPRVDGKVIKLVRKENGITNWQSDPLIQSYRAIVDSSLENTTVASALKGIMIDAKGKLQNGVDVDKGTTNRRQRRAGKVALKDYANDYNFGSAAVNAQKGAQAPVAENMYTIVGRSVDARALSKPLSGINNSDLRNICTAISSAVNRRTKRS